MPVTHYPGLLANLGPPFMSVGPNLPMWTHGEIYHAHAGRGATGNDGRDSLRPLATWQAAYNKCRASRGDIVLLLEGHTESIATATALDLDTAGVRTYGMGSGDTRPTITLATAAGATLTMSAANNLVSGIILDATGVASVTAGINVTAADCYVMHNRIITADATNQAVLGLLTDANADRLHLIGNRFEGTLDAGTASVIRLVGGDGIVIKDNYIYGAYTTTLGVENVTTALTDILIDNNIIKNRTASSAVCITMHADATGIFSNNRMSILSGTAPVVFAAGSNGGGNYYSAAVGVGAATLI